MKTTTGDKRRKCLGAMAALLSALVVSLAIAASPAAAEAVGETLPVYAGSLDFPAIGSAAVPEEYSWRVELEPGDSLTKVSETEAVIVRPLVEEAIHAPQAYDHHGAPVPTSLAVSEADIVTLTVHHREGAYDYPVSTETPEELDTAPIRDLDDGGFILGAITEPEAPERYPFRVSLGEEQELEQVSDTEVDVIYSDGFRALRFEAEKAHDADGAEVPTTLEQTGSDVITWVIHHRAGNPAAGGAPFDYPITAGSGWEGGFRTTIISMRNPDGEPIESKPATCKVPALRGLGLRAAKARLRSHHCAIGKVHLGAGATDSKGEVVKQFRAAGTELAHGAPVAIKLG